MRNKPKMKQLNRLAIPEIADIWERVAIQLNIKPQEVERIKRSQQVTSVKDNIIEMLRKWLDRNTASDSAKADELIEAVRTIGKKADAKEFETGWLLLWLLYKKLWVSPLQLIYSYTYRLLIYLEIWLRAMMIFRMH